MYHKLISPLLRVVWREAGHVVANSEGLRELAKEFYPQISVSVISNGVDVGEFKPEDRYWDPPHLLFVGRIVYQKGLDLLMKALLNLKDLPWKMTLVGDGPQLEILRSQAEQVGLLNRINFTGWVERDNLIELYQRANLFVFPSRHEGMPNAVLEAMACGLPVVASRIAGNKDLIIDGETGFLFAANDTKKLCIKLKRLLVDQDLRKVMGTAARDRASNVYSWRNTTQQYFKLIQGIKTD